MARVNTFNPKSVIFSINDFIIKDYASGTFIEIVQNNPYFKNVSGIRGKSTRVRVRDRTGIINLRLMQTSSDNEVLSMIAENDDVNQTGLLSVTIRDIGGDTGLQFGNAFLEGPPSISFSSDETTLREWRIHYQYITRYHVGGNNSSLMDFL